MRFVMKENVENKGSKNIKIGFLFYLEYLLIEWYNLSVTYLVHMPAIIQ
jgi:hypothetical protein